MMNPSKLRTLVVLGFAALTSACGDTSPWVDPRQIDETWVFTYGVPPAGSMHALLTGQAAVVDGCLQVDDFVVIWRHDHLDTVEEIIGRIDDGETVTISVGGGSMGEEEDGEEAFPGSVTARCSPSGIWQSAHGDVTIEDAE